MRLLTVTSIVIAAASLCQSRPADTPDNRQNHWCGQWAGSPRPADVPVSGQLPGPDDTKRFFVEPQLQRAPFAPIMASEPKVQIPKIWGNSPFFYFTPPLLCSFFLFLYFLRAEMARSVPDS